MKEEDIPDVPEITNPLLDEVVERYGCEDLLPVAGHIMWLAQVKEAMGFIPFKLNYETIRYLTILQDENARKANKDIMDARNKK